MITKLKSLISHKGFVKYFKNTSWLFAEKIIRLIVGLFVGIWVARYLGPEQFGLFSYAQSFVELFSAFATLGLDDIVVRELVKDESRRDEFLGTTFCLKLMGAILVLFILSFAVSFTSNDSFTNLLVFIIASATIFQSFNVIDFYLQSKVLSKYVVYANAISLLVSSIVKIILVLYEAPLVAFAWVVLFDSIVLALGFIYFYKKNNMQLVKWKFNKKLSLQLLKDSYGIILSGIAISLYMKIDQVIIGNTLDSKAVGYYAVAVRFSAVWLFVTVSITNSLFPAIINAKTVSEEIYKSRILNLYRLLVAISVIISIFIFIYADYLVLYTYGDNFKQSILLLRLYVWSIIFVFLNNGSWKWYISENLQHIATIRLLIGAIVNIVLNVYWIKKYGLVGSVYATLVSYAVATYFGNLFHPKTVENFKIQTKAIFTFYNLKVILMQRK